MSLIRDIIADSVADRLALTGESFKLLRTGLKFVAEYEENQNIELNEALGKDPRESGTIHVQDDAAASAILVNDLLTVTLFGQACKLQVLQRRRDNPGSPLTEFGVMKVTTKDAA